MFTKIIALGNGLNTRIINSCVGNDRNSWLAKLHKYVDFFGFAIVTNILCLLFISIIITFQLLKEILLKTSELMKGLIVLYHVNMYLFFERSTDFYEILRIIDTSTINSNNSSSNWFEQGNAAAEPPSSEAQPPPPPYSATQNEFDSDRI